MFGVRTVKLETCLERYAVGQPALDAFHLAVTGGIYEIINEFQYKLVAGIRNGEVFIEGLKQAFVRPIFRFGIDLKKIPERLDLDIKKIRAIRLCEG